MKMRFKYLHLISKSKVKYSLRNVIGKNQDHLIVTVDGNFRDFEDNVLPDKDVRELISYASVIFIHFLDGQKARIVNSLNSNKKVVWFCWGADAYYLGKFDNQFLLSKAKKARLVVGLKSWKGLKDLIKLALGRYSDLIPPNRDMIKAIKRADIIIPVVDKDYENLKDHYSFTAPCFQMNYVNGIFYDPPELKDEQTENTVLLGNSASFSNNHIEIIDHLSTLDVSSYKIYIPLIYGNRKYATFIANYALRKLGSSACIMEKRLTLKEYIQFLNSCECIVMNHTRQQGMGNVIIALWLEKTIFLNSKSGSYEFFKNKGFKIFQTENYSASKRLTPEEKKENRRLLFKWFSPDYCEGKFNSLLEYIENI